MKIMIQKNKVPFTGQFSLIARTKLENCEKVNYDHCRTLYLVGRGRFSGMPWRYLQNK